jgi:predicted cobalt transporter CbtA
MDIVEVGPMRRFGRFCLDQGIPAVLAIGLIAAQRFGYMALLPLNVVIEREYANYAMLLAAIAAFVTSATFMRDGWRFGIGPFLGTTLAGLVTASPFMFARYGMQFGLPPMQFALIATFAYLAFSVTLGLLIGGCWSVIVKAVRSSGPTY